MSCHLRADPSLSAADLDSLAPNCVCEQCSNSPYGMIESSETLIRFVVPPQHWDKKKQRVKAAALSQAETQGMSVYRCGYCSDEELLRAAQDLVGPKRQQVPTAGILGVLVLPADAVKSCLNESSPPYCIYDTELPNKPSHADVYQRVANCPDTIRQERRLELFQLVKDKFVPVADFRGGLLLPWAAQV